MSATVTCAPRRAIRKATSPVPPAMSRMVFADAWLHASDEAVLPQPVHPARHQVVHQVVAPRDRAEHAPTRRVFSSGLTSSSPKLTWSSWGCASSGLGAVRHIAVVPELPEVETTVRGLALLLAAADRQRRGAPARSSSGLSGRSRPAADRRARHRPRPPRQIWADRYRPRRHACLSPRNVGTLAGRSGRDRQARPFPHRDRRRPAGRAQRSHAASDRWISCPPAIWTDWPRSRRSAPSRPTSIRGTLQRRLVAASAAIKLLLLDQRIVAGLGNIYVCEALYRAGSSARAPADLSLKRLPRLVPAIREVIDEAIAAGGSTLRDFASARRRAGLFLEERSRSTIGRAGLRLRRDGQANRPGRPLDLLLPAAASVDLGGLRR